MRSIRVLDVTLRDGGCVNDFNFGQEYMDRILAALEQSGVDFIELGYLDEKKGTERGRTQYCNEQVISQYFLKHKLPGRTYVAMMDYGKFDPNKLKPRTPESIDGIRVAFHKKNWRQALACGRTILEKGYRFFIQPMLTVHYSDRELLELVEAVNKQLPDASGFYIVDSFGEMRANDVVRLVNLVDHNLNPAMALGFHSHNNLQLSYANAMSLLTFPSSRNLMLDASVMGMGKGAGNLNTELLLEHLNLYYGADYQIPPLLELIDQVINVIHSERYWGYSAEYYLSSKNHCTPSYAAHFYNKHMLPIDQVAELLSLISPDKRNSFDQQYAEELYVRYNARRSCDDSQTTARLLEQFRNRQVLIIAPGKSVLNAGPELEALLAREDVCSISLNSLEFDTRFVLTTRSEIYAQAKESGRTLIVPSNVADEDGGNDAFVIDYERWMIKDERTHDSSGVIALLLMQAARPAQLLLAGFDGFSVNINDNYYDPVLRKPVNEEQANRRNRFYSRLIQDTARTVPVRFLTPSLYQSESPSAATDSP